MLLLLFILCSVSSGVLSHPQELPAPGVPPGSGAGGRGGRPGQQQHRPAGPAGDCQPEAMARCTDPLKVVTGNKDLGFATSIDELEKMCP